MPRWTVAADGSGDYTSIQEAIDSVRVHWEERTVIFIKKGVYRERVTIPDNKPMISLVGESMTETIITYNLDANLRPNGKPIGTFETSVLTVHGDDFTAEHLTVHNTAGVGPGIGQALAVYVSGDRAVFTNVRMLSYQDTLYTSKGRQYFKSCFIAGHVDYIFGGATVLFHECEIHSLRDGYITAASTTAQTEFGFVFLDCKLTNGPEADAVYLGRPWRPHAHVAFINTWMGPHIRTEGWDNWRNPDNEKTARYMETGSHGPGGATDGRATWAKMLEPETAAGWTIERVFAGADGWNPVS
ncbi:pectinesterase family protein [Paenibacillus allorhizosphaerae]|uniref:Pectinesterase A n=1 Tax=Paenibacillus allorhizosphaerae TaxID=2849866 RepID=A0ABM8VFP2_9BACL|nr:pectinesterase family protein [Paenibacillus allorhizosphaerae]CAG7635568.1 Pectinesterase A [Paenibacillus allorhizosphaerae]